MEKLWSVLRGRGQGAAAPLAETRPAPPRPQMKLHFVQRATESRHFESPVASTIASEGNHITSFRQARSQGGAGGAMHPPKSAKRSTFSHKMGQKWGFCRRVKGVRFKKSSLWVQKVHFFGVPHPPKIDPGYGPAFIPVIPMESAWGWQLHTHSWRTQKILLFTELSTSWA